MPFYVEILVANGPTEFGADERDRRLLSVNIVARARGPIADWTGDIMKILDAAGVATPGTDCWTGGPKVPDGNGPYISVINSGGFGSDFCQQDEELENLSAQVIIRAASPEVARVRATAVKDALKNIRNATIA
jgi:hypothetical protein